MKSYLLKLCSYARFFCFAIVCLCLFFVTIFLNTTALARPVDLPDRFDLRNVDGHAFIGPVKNQAPLGTCYAFAAAAVAESTYNRAKNFFDDNAVTLSESFIMWSLGQKYEGFPTAEWGQGANYDYDELQALVDYGDCRAEEFPYTSDFEEILQYDTDDSLQMDYHWDAPRVRFAGWHRIPTNDIETIKRIIMTFGAVDAAVDADNDFCRYTDGVFSNSAVTTDNPLEYFAGTNHAISLIGWDDNPPEGGEGCWILRNSWSGAWGEEGYMRVSYTSARVATSVAYLHYGPWTGDDFQIVNTTDFNAPLEYSADQPVSRGLYEWGGNTASMVNHAVIRAHADVVTGNPYVHGMFLWAGERSRIENTSAIHAAAHTDDGRATAYGICLQGHEVLNTGTISVNAASATNDRATAYGVRLFGFDDSAVFENTATGTITAQAKTEDGWAYGLLSTDVSTIDNAGTMTAEGDTYAIGILSEGQTAVDNQGILSATATGGESRALYLYGGSAVNNGTIAATAESENATAYGMSGLMADRVDNTGSIQSTGGNSRGILVYYGKASNSGTITSTATSENGTAYGIQNLFAETIENSGSINAVAKMDAVGILSTGDTRVQNSGTISASAQQGKACGVELNGGILINESGGVISAFTQTGTACALKITDAQAINNGWIQGDTSIEENGRLNGIGLLTGDVTNNGGIVAPGNSIGVLTINGDYVQHPGTTLEIEVGNGASDQLIVTNTATILGGTLDIIPDGYTIGGNYAFFNAATVNGTFDTIVSPAVFDADVTATAAGISLDVTRNSYASLATNSGNTSMAGALDRIRPSAAGDMALILNAMDTMPLVDFQNALSDMCPGIHAAGSYASVQNTHRTMGYLRRHWKDPQTKTDMHGEPADDSRNTATAGGLTSWGSVMGSIVRSASDRGIPGFRESAGGVMFGMDAEKAERWTGGIAGAFTRQSLDGDDDSGSAVISSYRGYLYSIWDRNPDADGLYVTAAIGGGRVDFDTDRSIAFLDREAESRHSGYDGALAAGAGYEVTSGNWTIRPNLNIDYVILHENGYSESNAGDMNLEIQSGDSDSLQSTLGLSIAGRCRSGQAVVIPEFRFQWMHEFLSHADDQSARFIAADPSFDIPGRDIPRDTAIFGIALTALFSDHVFASLDYECSLMEANQGTANRFNARIQVRF